MRTLLFIAALCFCAVGTAQVGVNTVTPQAQLHVVGDISITQDVKVGGNASTAGDPGEVGQVLTSQGPNNPPIWSDVSGGGNGSLTYFRRKVVPQGSYLPDIPNWSSTNFNFNTASDIVINDGGYVGTNTALRLPSGYYLVVANIHLDMSLSFDPDGPGPVGTRLIFNGGEPIEDWQVMAIRTVGSSPGNWGAGFPNDGSVSSSAVVRIPFNNFSFSITIEMENMSGLNNWRIGTDSTVSIIRLRDL